MWPFSFIPLNILYLSKINNNNIVTSHINIVLKKYNSFSFNAICSVGMKKKLPLLPSH